MHFKAPLSRIGSNVYDLSTAQQLPRELGVICPTFTTYFWTWTFDRTAFAAAVADIRTLFRRAELPVVGPSGRLGTLPVLEDDFIGFNGRNQGCTCDPEGPRYHDWAPCWFGALLGTVPR